LTNNFVISPRIQDFLKLYVDSISQLEVLILLAENAPRSWTCEEVNARLRGNANHTEKHLESLRLKGFLSYEPQGKIYDFKPQSAEHETTIMELTHLYIPFKNTIISLIYEKPIQKIQSLADAFKLKKDD
jgi:hypothetical protein